jgi:hypothetical protein
MLSIIEVQKFLEPTKPELQDIVLELRNVIAEVAPGATEIILWRGLTYYDDSRGGPISGGICQIGIHQDHIRLAFIHGAFVADPKKILQGKGMAKRFVVIRSYEEAPWADLRNLISASLEFDPYSLQQQ